MNQDLRRIFEADQRDRTQQPLPDGLAERDADRRQRSEQLSMRAAW